MMKTTLADKTYLYWTVSNAYHRNTKSITTGNAISALGKLEDVVPKDTMLGNKVTELLDCIIGIKKPVIHKGTCEYLRIAHGYLKGPKYYQNIDDPSGGNAA